MERCFAQNVKLVITNIEEDRIFILKIDVKRLPTSRQTSRYNSTSTSSTRSREHGRDSVVLPVRPVCKRRIAIRARSWFPQETEKEEGETGDRHVQAQKPSQICLVRWRKTSVSFGSLINMHYINQRRLFIRGTTIFLWEGIPFS